MSKDLARLSFVLFLSLIAGYISGHVFIGLFIGLLLYILWHLQSLNNLLLWMKQEKRVYPPDVPGLIDDITTQFYKLRSRHKKRKKKLTNYLKRFRLTTQALPDAILILGENNEIKWANDKAEEYLGIVHREDMDQRVVNLVRHPSLVEFLKNNRYQKDEIESCINVVSPINKEMQLEVRLVHFGKSEKLLMARDISSSFRINKMRTDFISNASHELRTPLTVISGYLESFEDDFENAGSPDDFKRIIQMKSQAQRMSRLIDDLLNLATLETTEQLSNSESINVPEMLRSVIDAARSVGTEPGHEFKVNEDKELWLQGNRDQLYSVFSNLVFNAVNHTAPTGIITVSWFQSGSNGVFEVKDTGPGISPEHISRLTERFFRVDKSRSRDKGGSGLGLAIVKHILAIHESNLEIESTLDQGSTFRVIFPKSLLIRADTGESRASN